MRKIFHLLRIQYCHSLELNIMAAVPIMERIRRVKLETVHLTSVFLVWKCEYIALIDNFGLNFFLLFSSF